MGDTPPVTEQQKELAAQAMQEFDRKQFTSCCNIMNKLMALRGTDPRVVHNKAVADFCLSGSQSTDEFRQSLANVCQMVKINYQNFKRIPIYKKIVQISFMLHEKLNTMSDH
jgi:hypothetical protein